jgi:NTE family protein
VDLYAEQFDNDVFHHATFADLINSHQRPFLVMGATDISLGHRFDFTQEQFDFLYSDLASVPLARAVAASASFPVFLSPLAFENHPHPADFQEPPWIAAALSDKENQPRLAQRAADLRSYEDTRDRKHIRLIDGAISDYMGLREPLESFLTDKSSPDELSIRRMLSGGAIKKLIIISVNAVRTPAHGWDQNPSAPSWYDMLWFTAETPIRNNSADTVALFKDLLKADVSKAAGRYETFFITADFAGVPDPALRNRLENIQTTLSLNRQQVDDLRKAAAESLKNSPEFNRALSALQ